MFIVSLETVVPWSKKIKDAVTRISFMRWNEEPCCKNKFYLPQFSVGIKLEPFFIGTTSFRKLF